jgi:hypothetical protein
MLDKREPVKKTRQGKRRKNSRQVPDPHVGIFWLVDGKLLIDSIPMSEAETYGDNLTYPRGHADVWEQYLRAGAVPADMEYEESPRGRVMFDTRTRRFTLLADRCILRNKGMVRQIMSEMNLPSKNVDKGSDSHYRCSACLCSESK